MDNIYVERFLRSLKYEDIYIKSYETMADLKFGLNRYCRFYNTKRFHKSLDYQIRIKSMNHFRDLHKKQVLEGGSPLNQTENYLPFGFILICLKNSWVLSQITIDLYHTRVHTTRRRRTANQFRQGRIIMKRNYLMRAGVLAALVLFLAMPIVGQAAEITIFHFNDTHSRVEEGPYDGMGLAKLSAFIKAERSNNENVLVFDAGDTFHGQTIATLVQGESIARIMNGIGVDAMAPGNHDFNYGQARLLELDEETDYPILAANVLKNGAPILTPYTFFDVADLRIAVFGIATPETTYKTHPDNVRGLDFLDPVDAAKELVPQLREQADVVIGIVHLGVDPDSFHTSTRLAKEVPGIDLLIDGHSHTTLEEGLWEGETLIVQAGEYDKNLGKVTLRVQGSTTNLTASIITKEEAEGITPDPAVTAIISEVKESIEAMTSEVIGSTRVTLNGERGDVRAGETNLGNLITDAVLDATGADIVITNGGGIRASIPQGQITVGDVITVLPFGNYIITKEIAGADILAALEHGIDSYPETKGAFPHVAGIEVVFDGTAQPGNRLISVTLDGQPLDPEETYVLATNDFMAAGGDEYTMFTQAPVVGNFDGLDEILIEYIQKTGSVAPQVDGRMKTGSR